MSSMYELMGYGLGGTSTEGQGKPYETLAVLDAQPYTAYVDVYIGNWAFNKVPPDYLKSLEVERLSEGASKFVMVILDRFWDEVEETLHLGFNNITFRYGHVSGRQSRMWIGLLTDYSLEFTSAGVQLTINGTTASLRSNIHKLTHQSVETTPDEVFKEIATRLGWIVGRVDASLPIQDHSSIDAIKLRFKSWSIMDENPARYITEEVAPRAVREKDGKGGYQFYLDDSTSPPTANFHPIDIDPNTERTYIYHKGINTNVISFLPSFKGVFGAAGAGNATRVQSDSIDPVTKEESKVDYGIDSDPSLETTGDYTHTEQELSTVRVDATGMVHDEISSVAAYRWTNNFMQEYEASMEIVGDPTLEVMQTIRIIVMTDQGYLHHTSGVYMIKSIIDVIESGVLRTQLQLIRNASLSAGVEIIKYGIRKK